MSDKKIIIAVTKDDDGRINLSVGTDVTVMDLTVAFGILSIEVPFMVKTLQMQEPMKNKNIITPENLARG